MELVTNRIKLRLLSVNDADALVRAASDGALWQLDYTVIPDEQTVHNYIKKALNGYSEGTVIPFVIELLENNQIIGSTRFWKIDPLNRKLEIGSTWISASHQKTYVNTEAKYLMLNYAFETLNFIRVQFTTDEINEQSRKAILRLGAKEEGIIRYERIMPNGRKRNSVRFSIIEEEWPSIKVNLLEKIQFD
jgi:N-acetyltransferase